MGYDFEKTHELILKSAMSGFIRNGFSGASIRQICKDAGVTNGAFYSHFESKEDLFGKLVDPVLSGLINKYEEDSSGYKKIRSEKEFEAILKHSFESDSIMIHYVYENADAFRLILTAGAGTEYENLQDKIAAKESEWTVKFLEGCKSFMKKPENISEGLIKNISRFVVDTVFDSFLEGNTEEETLRQTQLASEFCITGLKRILGI